LSSFNYTYNPVGNRTHVVEADGDVLTLSYDPTYQLTNEVRSGANAYNISYTYDPVGNRTVLTNSGALTTNTYNPGNELVTSQASAGVTTSTYDGDGNLLTSLAPGSLSTTNTWDGENRLTLTALPTGIVDSFTYNGDGLRVHKQDSTGTTNHVWDGQNILLETNASNIIQVVYTLEPMLYGNLISQCRSGTGSFYLFDGLGSTTQLANSTGSVTDSYLYDSWGNILLTSGPTTNWFRYVGRAGYQWAPDLVAYLLRARFYAPGTALFLSRDPLALLESRASGAFRSYKYAGNNPVLVIDPSGKQPPPPSGGQTVELWDTEWWGYGNYCGWYRRGQNGPPQDGLDLACMAHDKCQATWWTCNPYHIITCSCQLCDDAHGQWMHGCALDYPTNPVKRQKCEDAARDIMNLFCLLGLW
jgi:RHS repeat-associated protein